MLVAARDQAQCPCHLFCRPFTNGHLFRRDHHGSFRRVNPPSLELLGDILFCLQQVWMWLLACPLHVHRWIVFGLSTHNFLFRFFAFHLCQHPYQFFLLDRCTGACCRHRRCVPWSFCLRHRNHSLSLSWQSGRSQLCGKRLQPFQLCPLISLSL